MCLRPLTRRDRSARLPSESIHSAASAKRGRSLERCGLPPRAINGRPKTLTYLHPPSTDKKSDMEFATAVPQFPCKVSTPDIALTQLLFRVETAIGNDVDAQLCLKQAVDLLRQERQISVRAALSESQINFLKIKIDETLHEKILVPELARSVRLSCGHFSKAFKISFGVTPHSYVMMRRILRAEDLLRSKNLQLTVIAYKCGFADQAHFTRHFKRMLGVTPSTWRRRNSRP